MNQQETLNIKAVLFDMDGVLCDSEAVIARAACRMFAEVHNTEVRPEDFIPFVGTGEDQYLGGVAAQYGVQLQMPEDKVTTYTLYLEMIKGTLEPLPGVHAFIKTMRAAGYRLAVATSADEMKMNGNLQEINLPPATFDACINGSMITQKKPHPEIFLTAAAAVGVKPEQTLVIEDAVNGVEAAKAAGAVCLGLTSSFSAETLQAAGADWTAPDLSEFPDTLKNKLNTEQQGVDHAG